VSNTKETNNKSSVKGATECLFNFSTYAITIKSTWASSGIMGKIGKQEVSLCFDVGAALWSLHDEQFIYGGWVRNAVGRRTIEIMRFEVFINFVFLRNLHILININIYIIYLLSKYPKVNHYFFEKK
jgi:hypothetical protein